MKEIWKDIDNLDKYQISNQGRIRSCFNKVRVLSCYIARNGYVNIVINKKHYTIHRLVAQAFIPNPKNKPEINHIDGDKSNNNVENLEWVTKSENEIHSYHILKKNPSMKKHFGRNHVRAIKINQFDKNDNFIKQWDSIVDASNFIKIPSCCISNCARNRRKTAGGFIWRYADK